MRKGFLFDQNKCVNCNACSAACILENNWKVHPRNIYTFNSEAEILLPLLNVSLACNHCESAVCMDGCPSSAYSREVITGAIIHDESKCIGCKYCQWNCPYDAPKFDSEKRTIAKCNLCYTGLIEGRLPACSSACPTGALRFGQLSEPVPDRDYSWFPDRMLNPAFEFTSGNNYAPLKIIPEKMPCETDQKPVKEEKNFSGELSLIIFSFLVTISVSTLISSLIRGVLPEKMIIIPMLILAGLASFFHLGRKLRSWRSVANMKNSPLSREVAAFVVFTFVTVVNTYLRFPSLLIVSLVIGLFLLALIDGVYVYSDKSKSVILHSGQTFLSALLIGSFFSGIILPFAFIALIKLTLSINSLKSSKILITYFGIRFLRIAFLIISGLSLISKISYTEPSVYIIFLTGELLDRILFYIDFNPLNIKSLFEDRLKIERDEKKRC